MKNRSGFSLLELIVSVGILAMVMTALFEVAITTDRTSEETSAMAALETDTLKVIERITAELINCTDDVESGFIMQANSFSAAPVTGWDYDEDEATYGDFVTWSADMDDDEQDDGIDNDGDNLIDEMILTRTDSNGTEIICSNVDENGLQFTKTEKEVQIALTLTGFVKRTQTIITKTISPVTVTLRN